MLHNVSRSIHRRYSFHCTLHKQLMKLQLSEFFQKQKLLSTLAFQIAWTEKTLFVAACWYSSRTDWGRKISYITMVLLERKARMAPRSLHPGFKARLFRSDALSFGVVSFHHPWWRLKIALLICNTDLSHSLDLMLIPHPFVKYVWCTKMVQNMQKASKLKMRPVVLCAISALQS